MDSLISIAIHIGKLEARIQALEARMEPRVAPEGKTGGKTPGFREEEAVCDGDTERTEEERQAEKRFQEGIDNILGYEWPMRKGDGKDG